MKRCPVPPPNMPKTVTITLDARQLDIIARYRAAKERMSKAVDAAIANQGENHLWTDADREAVSLADDALTLCRIEMCVVLDLSVPIEKEQSQTPAAADDDNGSSIDDYGGF